MGGFIETVMMWVQEFLLQIGLIVVAYILTVIAVLLDLNSGIRKAKRNGVFRSSYKGRRTFSKFNEYGNSLLILTVFDFMQMLFFQALNGQIAVTIPVMPVVTFIGCAGVILVEYRSIKENSEYKTKIEEVEQAATQLVQQLANNPNLFNQVLTFLKQSEHGSQQGFTQQQSGQYPNIGDQIQRGGDPIERPGL